MKKRLKITLYCLIAIAIIAVVGLMLGNIKTNTKKTDNLNTENGTGETITGETINGEENILYTEDTTFEEDVMKDLEGFFNDNNGYEDVEGEYGFTEPENE